MNLLNKALVKMFMLAGCRSRICGRDRQVFILKKCVVKIPVMSNGWFEFVRGYYSNLKEMDSIRGYEGNFPEHLPEILGSYLFGLVVVYKKYREIMDGKDDNETGDFAEYTRFLGKLDDIRRNEKNSEKYIWTQDTKIFNFGWDKYGRVVVIDLGTPY
ncbi:hypothetical protein PQC06_gp107 [Aeromonas phage LAh10]|uniref:Uncharacterized protein n=1 Tax=Aeromonas phage LAh10 TaxID=2591025 RepID=A0A514A1R8_9CAUD|nr:hypothetical protein PQC06_gp107 [Aeromonas phage LAh10]QDH47175.1 hypothetical protein LAh10_107 [Aeromonas phage LAh10]